MQNELRLVTQDTRGRPLRWRDAEGVLHAVEQTPQAEPTDVASWWTRCGAWQLSYTAAWGGNEEPTCPACRIIEHGL